MTYGLLAILRLSNTSACFAKILILLHDTLTNYKSKLVGVAGSQALIMNVSLNQIANATQSCGNSIQAVHLFVNCSGIYLAFYLTFSMVEHTAKIGLNQKKPKHNQ